MALVGESLEPLIHLAAGHLSPEDDVQFLARDPIPSKAVLDGGVDPVSLWRGVAALDMSV